MRQAATWKLGIVRFVEAENELVARDRGLLNVFGHCDEWVPLLGFLSPDWRDVRFLSSRLTLLLLLVGRRNSSD